MRRARIAASALALALVASPAAALAQVTFSGTLTTPSTKVGAKTRSIIYYLEMHSGAQEERFGVRITPPRFATAGPSPSSEGESVDGPRAVALQGPGTIGTQSQGFKAISSCSTHDSYFHGYATGDSTVDLLLPPNSNTTLAVRYATGARAPWPDTDFRLTFTALPELVGSYAAGSLFAAGPTLTSAVTVRTKGPVPGRSTGVHILLSTRPAGKRGAGTSSRHVSKGKSIAIRGRILPARAHRRIELEWARPGGSLHRLQDVKTDRHGHFAAKPWRPGSGRYELWARYPKQPGGQAPDITSCPLRYTVG